MKRDSTLFPSFNARNLTPKEVAATFVPNDEFDLLWTNNHVLLLGPRGSGKTTLLKMLTAQALRNWKHRQAPHVRAGIPFYAVYVPADIHWSEQLSHTTQQLEGHPRLQRAIAMAAITTNVLMAVCVTFEELLKFEVAIKNDRQVTDLSKALIRDWRLPPTVPCLDQIASALSSRLNELRLLINEIACTSVTPRKLPSWVHLDYLSAVSAACAAFARIFRPAKPRWALCFDELEIAPEWFQQMLYKHVRSTDQRFLFKLSTSPIPPSLGETLAKPQADFKLIPLWHHGRKQITAFSEALTASLIKQKLGRSRKPREIFGSSPLANDNYSKGSETWRMFREAAQHDPKFDVLLKSYGLTRDNPTSADSSVRDSLLRKAKPIVMHRLEYRKVDKLGHPTLRSRKAPSFCHGVEAIYEVSDGNPRWLTGIVSELLALARKKRSAKVSDRVQIDALLKASQQFCALIQTLRQPETSAADDLTLIELLQKINDYFFQRLVFDEFRLDPAGSFIVDARFTPHIEALLRLAIDNGALVYVDPRENAFDSDLRGKRFRLSYLFSPNWKLPLRCYYPVKLSRILDSTLNDLQIELPFTGL